MNDIKRLKIYFLLILVFLMVVVFPGCSRTSKKPYDNPYLREYLKSSASTYRAPSRAPSTYNVLSGQIWNRKGLGAGAFNLQAQQSIAASGSDWKKDILDLSDSGALGVTGFRGNIGSANNTLFLKIDSSAATGLKMQILSFGNLWKPMAATTKISYVKKDEWYLLQSGFDKRWSFALLHILDVDPEAGSSPKGNTGMIQFEYCLFND